MIEFPPRISDPNSTVGVVHFGIRDRKDAMTLVHVEDIILPMPEDIKIPSTVSWNEGGLSIIGNAIDNGESLQKTGADLIGRVIRNVEKTVIGNLVGTGSASIEDSEAFRKKTVKNPNIQVIFRGVGLRDFSISYTFVAYSEEESRTIKKLVDTFRKYQLPPGSYKYDRAELAFPGEFDINFLRYDGSVNPYFRKYASMVMTGIDFVSSSGLNTSMYRDGAPITVSLSMSFKETKVILRDDIDNGY